MRKNTMEKTPQVGQFLKTINSNEIDNKKLMQDLTKSIANLKSLYEKIELLEKQAQEK